MTDIFDRNLSDLDQPEQLFEVDTDEPQAPLNGSRPDIPGFRLRRGLWRGSDLYGTVEDIPFAPELPFVVARLSLRNLSTYEIRPVVWLDKPFLQRGAFHLLGGRKGVCKGTWLSGIAARVTTGDLYGEPKRVLVITSEDSIELDFLPRVVAAGGDPSMVEIVNGAVPAPDDIALAETAGARARKRRDDRHRPDRQPHRRQRHQRRRRHPRSDPGAQPARRRTRLHGLRCPPPRQRLKPRRPRIRARIHRVR